MIDIDNPSPSSATALDTQLFECSPDCVKLLDAQGCVIAMNKNGQCAMEIDNQAMVAGKPWKALWPDAAHQELDKALSAACEGRVGHFSAFCPTAKGTPKWWDVIVTPVLSGAGSIESFLSVSRDVTAMHQAGVERERLLRDLQAANARMTDIFQQAPAFMCALRGPDHVFEMVNERYLQLVGNRNPVGQTVRQALPELEGQGFFELLDQVFRTGEPFKGTDLPVLLQRAPDTALEERFVDFVYMVLRDAQGSITGILVHGVDQTERKHAEFRLYDSRERFQKIVHQAGTGIVETNADGDITLVNRKYCDMLGYTQDDLMGVNVLDLTACDSLFATQELVTKLQRGGPGFVIDEQYRRKDGSFKWATSSVNPLRDANGNYQGLVAIVVDITDSRSAAEALRASEERYRTLFESMDQGFCIIEMMQDAAGKNVDYRFLQMNAMFEQHTGLRDALNKTVRQLVPDLDSFWVETYGRVAVTGESVRLEHHEPAMNRWFDVHATRIGGANSNQVALLFRDISARKQRHEDLQRYAARQAFQLQLADRLRPLAVPDEVTAAASELLGQHLQLSRVFYCDVDDERGTFFIRQDWTAAGIASVAGEVRRLDDFGPELIADVRPGRNVVVDDTTLDPRTTAHAAAYTVLGIRANASVPLLKGGRLSAILALHDDVPHHWTEYELALAQDTVERTWAAVDNALTQQSLFDERNRSQAVLDSMTEGFALLDCDWKFLEVNENGAHLAQHERSSLIGQNHWQALPELVGTELELLYRRVGQSRQAETAEYLHTYPNGGTCWLEVRVHPTGEDRLAVFFRDISERKQIEQELRDASRRKDDFLAMLAHELRNPLAPIGAAADLLQLGRLDEGRVKKTSEIIGRQVHHMTHLIDDLLDVSRVTRGLVELDESVVEIRHAVNEAVEQVTPLIHARHHHLAVHLAPDASTVFGDRKRLVQVMANLLNNAAKYTNEGGQIELRTTIKAAQIVINVIDNGIGMAPKLVAHAFDLFTQAERTSDRSSGGLGLGLALVKSLVELHSGTVTCASEGLGKGSTFTVCLPRLLEPANQVDQLQGGEALQPTHEPLRVLVVDDNVDAAVMLTMLLEAAGHEVLVEHGAYRALERARVDKPQVCLIDIGLPELDGNQVAQRLRSLPETANAVLIAVTGYGQDSDRKSAFAAGFDHHLVKPVDTKRLATILNEIAIP